MGGGADARVNASIPATEMKMKELGKVYEPHVFEGAAHGFLRAQSGNDGANMKATQEAWPLTIAYGNTCVPSGAVSFTLTPAAINALAISTSP